MTGWVNLERSSPISRHLSICSEAKDSTYVRDIDLKSWAELPGKEAFLQHFPRIFSTFLLIGLYYHSDSIATRGFFLNQGKLHC